MFRVLHVMAGADAGGISTVVLNYYRYLNRDKIHFDIAVTTDAVGQNGERFKQLGSKIYFLPLKSNGLKAFENALYDLLIKERFDAVHIHENETSYIALRVAKKAGIPCRVAHSHTSSPYVSFKSELRRLSGCWLNYHYATKVIGCGKLAGERVFGKINMKRPKALVLPNAIETEKFTFNPQIRNAVRKQLDVEQKLVFGMVGRLSEEKNYFFAIELLKKLHNEFPNSVLLIAGNGPEEEKIRSEINKSNMKDCVRLLGRRGDVERLYQAFDIFLLPSLHEGFPVAAVEAMASGLPVLMSNTITDELKFGSAVRYLPLSDMELWVKAVMEFSADNFREKRTDEIKENGLDIKKTAEILEKIYLLD